MKKIMALAVEAMFEEITMYFARDEHSVRASVYRKLTPEQVEALRADDLVEDDCFARAVEQAVLFYEDEAGGSHDLEWLANSPSWAVLEALPN